MFVTVFCSYLKSEHAAKYYEVAAPMRMLAEDMAGFISFKTFNAEDGERMSVIEFESEETLYAPGESTQNTGRHKISVARFTILPRFKYAR
jgi:heme-degrading monooxygenase HmoA